MNWQDGTPKSTDNDFNAVPISYPEKKRSHKSTTPRAKHYKKKETKQEKELRFDATMAAMLAVKKGSFCPHIPTPEENDRTR